jgi:hypothetical protein
MQVIRAGLLICLLALPASANDYGAEGNTFHLMPPTWSVLSASKKREVRKQRALNWYREHYEDRSSNRSLRARMKADWIAKKASTKVSGP